MNIKQLCLLFMALILPTVCFAGKEWRVHVLDVYKEYVSAVRENAPNKILESFFSEQQVSLFFKINEKYKNLDMQDRVPGFDSRELMLRAAVVSEIIAHDVNKINGYYCLVVKGFTKNGKKIVMVVRYVTQNNVPKIDYIAHDYVHTKEIDGDSVQFCELVK